jgi:uncharacterized coiled-coil protein SlyX
MARGDDNKRIEDLEKRAAMHDRELVILADTIKELATQLQQLAQAQVTLLDKHDDLIRKIADMDRTIKEIQAEAPH